MNVHQYVCMYVCITYTDLCIYIHMCVHAVQCFALLFIPPLTLKVAKQGRPNLPRQDYVTKATFTEMPTWKYQSKRLV
jgi:hypothetical protein